MLVPTLMLRAGRVMVPGDAGPVAVADADGRPVDLFDVVDRLTARFPRVCVVDLDGIERNRPQLDYLQEISRDLDVWLVAGVRTADQAIDALVTGASRVVLSSSSLASARELKRAWKLSQDLAIELEVRHGAVVAREPGWEGAPAPVVAQAVRETGLAEIVLSPRADPVDWSAVRVLAQNGPTWVDGTFDPADRSRLIEAGAAGGFFHLDAELQILSDAPVEGATGRSRIPRDDDT